LETSLNFKALVESLKNFSLQLLNLHFSLLLLNHNNQKKLTVDYSAKCIQVALKSKKIYLNLNHFYFFVDIYISIKYYILCLIHKVKSL